MQNIFDASEKLFFSMLIISLLSFIYFTAIPMSKEMILFGIIFSIFYFGTNFYIGYKYNLKILEAFVVGIIGCSIGIFFSFFAIYSQFILDLPNFAVWLIKPYYIPITSLIELNSRQINLNYSFYLMIVNILLVIFGSFSKIIMNKLLLQFK